MKCEHCGASILPGLWQLAHRIPQTKRNLAYYGSRVVHHDMNLAHVCSLACNSAVSISNHPMDRARLLVRIYTSLAEAEASRIKEP